MSGNHTLSVNHDGESASVTCVECPYSFIAPMSQRRFDLSKRVWLNRGDRTVQHTYMATADEMTNMAVRATLASHNLEHGPS